MNEILSCYDILHCLGVDSDRALLAYEALDALLVEMLETGRKDCCFGQMAVKICKEKHISLKIFYAQLKRQLSPAMAAGAAIRCGVFGLPPHPETSAGLLYALARYEFTVSGL